MKRDNDYLRELLFKFERDPEAFMIMTLTCSSSEEEKKRKHHAELLHDAGLLASINDGVYRLTNKGHDFIEATRDEGIWKSTQDAVVETGGSATLEIIKSLAVGFLKQKITKHTGIDI